MKDKKNESIFKKIYRVLLKEKRVPISWESKYQDLMYKSKLDKILKKISEGDPIACTGNKKAEIHMLTCKRDLLMSIAAFKSLLRFYNDFSIIIHDDGSLSSIDIEVISRALPGAEVVTADLAEKEISKNEEALNLRLRISDRFELGKGYELQRRAWAKKVFDFHMLSESHKLIVLDSDVLFLKRPEYLIGWVQGIYNGAFFSKPQFPNNKVKKGVAEGVVPGIKMIESFNGGLYGYEKEFIDIDFMTSIVRNLVEDPDFPIMGDECIWRVIFSIKGGHELPFNTYPLITPYYQRHGLMPNLDEACYVHFISKHRGGLYGKIAKGVLDDLKNIDRYC